MNKIEKIVLTLLALLPLFSIKLESQPNEILDSKSQLLISITKLQYNHSIGAFNQYAIQYSNYPFNSNTFFTNSGFNFILIPAENFGIFIDFGYRFKIFENSFISPILGVDNQFKHWSLNITTGLSFEYFINSFNDLLDKVVVGVDLKYQKRILKPNENSIDIYSSPYPKFGLKIGYCF
jgi:hypothetical protein